MTVMYKSVNGKLIQFTDAEVAKRLADGEIIRAGIEAEAPLKARTDAYPPIAEQLDMLYHELDGSGAITKGGEWFLEIKRIKEQFPITKKVEQQ